MNLFSVCNVLILFGSIMALGAAYRIDRGLTVLVAGLLVVYLAVHSDAGRR